MRVFLTVCGTLLFLVAAWFLYAGFSMETTVPASNDAAQLLGSGAQGIANLQLMHFQLIDIVIGVTSALGTCVLWGSVAIVDAIERQCSEGRPR